MSKQRRVQAKRIETHHQDIGNIAYDSPEWKAANELVNSYQHSVNEIRAGRERVGHILGERWSDWYNALMTISFALGGALIAVAPVLKFETTADQVLFWASTCLFIIDGLYILLLRKARLERESVAAINMGYEIEYYSLVAKNRVLDILKGQHFMADEFEAAKNMLLNQALGELDMSYEETRKIDEHMDIMSVIFLASLSMLCISRVSSTIWLQIAGIAVLAVMLVLLLTLRAGAIKPKEALKKRDMWLEKIKPERTDK